MAEVWTDLCLLLHCSYSILFLIYIKERRTYAIYIYIYLVKHSDHLKSVLSACLFATQADIKKTDVS